MTTDPPESAPEAPPNGLGSLDPGELLARGLNTVQPTIGQGPWVPPEPEELARLLPQYSIERLLGHGGMGAVYQGEQTALRRKVAIKLLPADLATDAQFVARFQREARMLARLQHPGIVAVYDCGQSSEGHLYFVMEYVEGTDLQRVLREPGLNPEQAMELIMQICDALHYAHRQGVIHRDIKPANILIGIDGHVKVADFGLARPNEADGDELTQTNMVMGTPAYMAPEQRMGQADQRADIFALGVMLYEMLTGKRPHGAFDPPSHKVQVDVRIDGVVLRALQCEPERRYQEVSEMRGEMEQIRSTPLPAEAPPAPGPARRPRRWKWPLALGGGLVLAGLALYYFFPERFTLGLLTGTGHQPRAAVAMATPAPVLPVVDEADRRALEAALFGSDWLYSIGSGGARFHELHFEQAHIVRTNRGQGALWHWWIVGARSVHLQFANEAEQYDPQRGTNLKFDSSLKKFQGLTADGLHRQSGEPIPKPAAATPMPRPLAAATPVPPPPARSTPAPPLAISIPRPATPVSAPPWPAPGNKMSEVSGMKQVADIQFARGLSGFPQLDDKKWKTGLVTGEYQMLCRDGGLWWPGEPLRNLRGNEFVCEVRARVVQNEVGGWGLGFINGDGDDHTWVGVQVDGAGMLNSHTFADGSADWPWQYSPAMKRGAEANTIRIEATGQRVRVFANGVFVFERQHQKIRPNSSLALFCFGKRPPEDVRILSVQVWTPPGGTSYSPPASTPAPVVVRGTPTPVAPPPVDLFTAQTAGFWKTAGGIFRVEGGAWTTSHPQVGHGTAWYTKQTYSDFTLRLEFLTETVTANSGVQVRSPAQLVRPNDSASGYEIQILGDPKDPQPTGAIYGIKPPTSVPQRAGWNSLEIMVLKQDYTVTLNGVVTNRFTGDRALAGYIGLQCHHAGPVKFRNVRITDLSGTGR